MKRESQPINRKRGLDRGASLSPTPKTTKSKAAFLRKKSSVTAQLFCSNDLSPNQNTDSGFPKFYPAEESV